MFKSIISLHVDNLYTAVTTACFFKALRMSAWFQSCFSLDWTASCVTVVCIVKIKKYRATSLQIIVYKPRLQSEWSEWEREVVSEETSTRKHWRRRWRRESNHESWHFLWMHGRHQTLQCFASNKESLIINYCAMNEKSLYPSYNIIIIFSFPTHHQRVKNHVMLQDIRKYLIVNVTPDFNVHVVALKLLHLFLHLMGPGWNLVEIEL